MIGVAALWLVAGQSRYFPATDAVAVTGCPPMVAVGSGSRLARSREWLERVLSATGGLSLYSVAGTGDGGRSLCPGAELPSHDTRSDRRNGIGDAALIAMQGSERGGDGSPGVGATVDRLLRPDEVRTIRPLLDAGTLFVPRANKGVRMLDGANGWSNGPSAAATRRRSNIVHTLAGYTRQGKLWSG